MQLIDSWFGDRVLMAALMASAGVHALVLAIRFVDPELLRTRQSNPTLEIVLVNAKSEARPSKPQALAQANSVRLAAQPEPGQDQDAGRQNPQAAEQTGRKLLDAFPNGQVGGAPCQVEDRKGQADLPRGGPGVERNRGQGTHLTPTPVPATRAGPPRPAADWLDC